MILVILENSFSKASLCAISAAKKLTPQSPVVGLLMGKGDLSEIARQYSEYGLDKILTASSDSFENYLAVPYAEFITGLEEDFKYIVAANTTFGRDLSLIHI